MCELTRFSASAGNVVESDIRIDARDAYWTNDVVQSPNRRHIRSGMVHEVGHSALFGHVSNTKMVMAQGLPAGNTLKQFLSFGDATGNNTKY
jgi:hypothetical protein